jgi:hypothetical protein
MNSVGRLRERMIELASCGGVPKSDNHMVDKLNIPQFYGEIKFQTRRRLDNLSNTVVVHLTNIIAQTIHQISRLLRDMFDWFSQIRQLFQSYINTS